MSRQKPPKAFLHRACPRCLGDLVLDAEMEPTLMPDERVQYVCLQCGHRTSFEATRVANKLAVTSQAA